MLSVILLFRLINSYATNMDSMPKIGCVNRNIYTVSIITTAVPIGVSINDDNIGGETGLKDMYATKSIKSIISKGDASNRVSLSIIF